MARIVVTIRKNADDTYTIRVGRQVEHISTYAKDRGEIFDAIKYAAMSKGAYLDDVALVELLDTNRIQINR